MNFSGLSLSARQHDAPSNSPSRSKFASSENPKVALAGFADLEVTPNPNGAMTANLDSLNLGFTTPTKRGAPSPRSKSTTKKNAPKFAAMSLGDSEPSKSTPTTPKSAKTTSPKKRVNLSGGFSVMSLARDRASPKKTPSPKKLQLEDASFMSVNGSTPKSACDLSPSKLSPTKSCFRTSKTPSPKKVSFADEASFQFATASTPKLSRDPSPQFSPSMVETSEFSVMSTTSPAASQVSQDPSPVSIASRLDEEEYDDEQTVSLVETPSRAPVFKLQVEDTPAKASEMSAFTPSKASDAGSVFQSPSKIDISMHDVTWMSDYAPTTGFQTYTFATVDLTDAARALSGPFQPELFEKSDYTTTLSRPWSFPSSRLQQKQARAVNRKKRQRRTKQEAKMLMVEKAILEQVADSLTLDELDAAPEFRVIAQIGRKSYVIGSRKRLRTEEDLGNDVASWYDIEEGLGLGLIIDAQREVRNQLFHLPMGPTVGEIRKQYLADMKRHGEPMVPVCSKRSYKGTPKRAYSNDLLTHMVIQQLLEFPQPELSYEFVLEHLIAESDKAQGRRTRRARNVRQLIAVYGEPEVSIIEEDEEPQSPTPKLPHFPSTATHHSSASRKLRLVQGADNLRARIESMASIPEPPSPSPAPAEPLSSPIGPGFTFQCPSFMSSPSASKTSEKDEAEFVEDVEEEQQPEQAPEPEVAASPAIASPVVVFKDRTPAKTAFKNKRRSLPAFAITPLSFSSPARRASLQFVAGSDQHSSVQNLAQDPASESQVVAPTSVVELSESQVQNPITVDSASSRSEPEASPAPAVEESPKAGSSSPASVVVDVRENMDIFGSSQERVGSPIHALASLARVFEENKEAKDAKVVVERLDGRLIVRFKVPDEHAALFTEVAAVAAASSSPVGAGSPIDASAAAFSPVDANESATPISPDVLPTSPSPVPIISVQQNTPEKDDEEKDLDEEEEDDVLQVPTEAVETLVAETADVEVDDDSELALLRSFVSRHAASRAARAAEATAPAASAPVVVSPMPSAPILLSATPERRPQGIWADTPSFSVECPRTLASPAPSSTRQPLGVLDANSPSPKKVKRKADGVEEREPSPEKPASKKPRKAKADKNTPGKPEKNDGEDDKGIVNVTPVLEADPDGAPPANGPVPGVRTRAQRAAARGETPVATRIPMRHQVAKVRNGEKDLATLTRQNTKTNKGGAIPADEMLEKLKNAGPAVETRAAAAAKKDGKNVSWAEQLARSQSEEPPLLSPSPELSQEEAKEVGKATKVKRAATPKKPAKATATATTKAVTAAPATPAAAAKKPAATTKIAKAAAPSKLRQPGTPAAAAGPKTEGAKVTKTTKKVTAAAKKEVVGAVNGTPAKRSRRIAEKK
ncbi:hypothetical protein GCG54_00014503 [Colletotrichum gloeosporioides]|uniref:Uncharacterized protein n=1 Tax=Colletotrichum gloeosporioides TaxID=474922 RepID=A0A8H4CXQ5_COLGL|nr:uncharacterized protein GCG54_00014503 [Colletotrichum gloeosporioides]KAF3811752.1 hypothetical protein GCG54_00014503 [Colletotrichum gloeosporioides]